MYARNIIGSCLLTVVSVCLVLSGCNRLVPSIPEPAAKRNGKSGDSSEKNKEIDSSKLDPASWEKRIRGLRLNAEKIASDLNNSSEQLVQLFTIKNLMCERQSQLMTSCIAHTPLSQSSWRTGAACRTGQSALEYRNFTAEIRGVDGKFQLVLDNSIESNIFESGKETILRWTSRGSRSLRDLKLSDIGVIKLKAIEGTHSDLPFAAFVFKVGEKTLLNERDFLLSGRTETAAILSHLAISAELATPSCHVDESEIESLIQTAVQQSVKPVQVSAPSESAMKNFERQSEELEAWINQSKRELQTKDDSYLALAQDVSRLRRDLRGELQMGCWAREKIKTIEIFFKGMHLEPSEWDRSETRQALGNYGNPTQTTIDFGGDLRFVNQDEQSLALFREDGRWLNSANTDLTLGDISSIQLQKGGYSYQALKNCWSTWGGLGTACEWQNRETDRYLLNALTIKINGETIYAKDALNVTFERSNLKWVEKDLTANQAYIDLMRRRDCPVAAMPE